MPTQYQGPIRNVRALNVFINLMRSSESLMARLQKRLDKQGITAGQFGVLETLLHLGPLCHTVLGQKLLRTDGNVTMIVDNLEKRGLVRRLRTGEDRRYVSVNLTPQGKTLIEKIFPEHAAAITEEMSVLSVSEQENLRRLCRKVGKKEDVKIKMSYKKEKKE